MSPSSICPTARVLLAAGALCVLTACQSTKELDRGDLLVSEGRAAEAMGVWRQALAAAPTDTRLLIRIATAQARMGRLEDAEATMLKAVAIEPKSARVRQNLALVYLRQKDFEKALATFNEVLELESTYPETHYYIGLIHEMRGDEATAVTHYVLDVNNGPSRAWERLERYKERQRERGLGPREPRQRDVLIFSLACLAVAAVAYGLRVMFDIRRGDPPSDPGS